MYTGRFAPSPTGKLHFGSLLAALASYLDARHNHGHWLLRIDDIDPPREMPGATQSIIDTLQAFGLNWDGDIIFQSKRSKLYQRTLDQLIAEHLSYPCNCSRKQIANRSSSRAYDGHCLKHPPENYNSCAWRFKSTLKTLNWTDNLMGKQTIDENQLIDFILKRSDGLWAYQLAVAVDDAAMGITHVVRGCDLLQEAGKQQSLMRALNFPDIEFSHIPLAKSNNGQKLSKQNLAPALPTTDISSTLYKALQVLGQQPTQELKQADKKDLLDQAIIDWNPMAIPLEYTDSNLY